MRISFFKIPKAKAFDYKPLYYDPKNDPEINLSGNDEEKEVNKLNARIKVEMNDKWVIGKNKGKYARGFLNTRSVLIYLAIALILLYFIFG